MQGIYTYIPETNYVPREYSVAAILLLLFVVLISLVPVLNLLYFYISTFRSRCAVPNMAVIIIIIIIIVIDIVVLFILVDRGTVEVIRTCYGLNCQGDRIPMGTQLPGILQTEPGAKSVFCKMGNGSLCRRVRRPGRGVDNPTPCTTEVKERVEVKLCFPFGLSWLVLG